MTAALELIEIRDLLTTIYSSGIQKYPEMDGGECDRSRSPERLSGRPDMFLIRTLRERSTQQVFSCLGYTLTL